jgi:hypothetical protein
MSDNIISPNDAGLVLHKFVTEGLPVLAYFVSADRSRAAKFSGFVQSFTQINGLVVGMESPLSRPETLRAWMKFSLTKSLHRPSRMPTKLPCPILPAWDQVYASTCQMATPLQS